MSAINTNLQALQNAANLSHNEDLLGESLNKLSSGSRLSSAATDPVALADSSKLTSQDQRLDAAASNVQNAISYTQTADSLLQVVGNMLDRMRQLVGLAQDPTKTSDDVSGYAQEFISLQEELRSIIGGTTTEIGGTSDVSSPSGTYDGIQMFGSSSSGYQVALGESAGESMTVPASNLRTGAMLSLIQQDSSGNFTLDISTATDADLAGAIDQVTGARASIGAAQSRLEIAASSIASQSQNLSSSISQLSDVDVAAESTTLTSNNLRVQFDAAILAQANAMSEKVLVLLQE